MCRDDDESRPSSLGEFLEVKLKFGDVALFGASDAELEGGNGRTRGDVFHWREGAAAVAAEEEATGLICSEILLKADREDK
ncbi:hypothetical protein RHGRI_000008 [Rhododendron griersonianum]|uniref:Uncharacterized protein n=1 Tax=Rhododendron griersonianum TaxID=479676 RepID=A0AAV6LHW5_9ERIC|nr:hypothetical protein RHGRI_000008 [Rhododendron griersonianum]